MIRKSNWINAHCFECSQKFGGTDRAFHMQLVYLLQIWAPICASREVGISKDIFAQAVHARPGLAAWPWIAANSAAIPPKRPEKKLATFLRGTCTLAHGIGEALLHEPLGRSPFRWLHCAVCCREQGTKFYGLVDQKLLNHQVVARVLVSAPKEAVRGALEAALVGRHGLLIKHRVNELTMEGFMKNDKAALLRKMPAVASVRHIGNSRLRAIVTILAVAVLAQGCATTMSPQIFSDELLSGDSSRQLVATASGGEVSGSGRIGLPQAIESAENLQRKYFAAVKNLSEIAPTVTTGLIGISALAAYNAVTHPRPDDLAAAGLLGSAAYAYGNSVTSKPRQRVYLEGVKALTCAIGAVRPFDLRPADGSTDSGLKRIRNALTTASVALGDLKSVRARIVYLNDQNEIKVVAPKAAKPPGCERKPVDCKSLPPADAQHPATIRQRCEAVAAAWAKQCAPGLPAEPTIIDIRHPQTTAAFAESDAQIRNTSARIADVNRLLARADAAGGVLWDKVKDIQTNVADQVLNTEPDLSAVLETIQSLRDNAYRISGSASLAPAPPTGKAQSKKGVETKQLRPEQPPPEIAELVAAIKAARDATVPLDTIAAQADQAVRDANAVLAQCKVGNLAMTLNVTPSDDTVSLKANEVAVFSVSGGSGAPRVLEFGGKGVAAKRALLVRDPDESGSARWIYTAPGDVTADDMVVIVFSDAPGAARKEVKLVFDAQAAPVNSLSTATPPSDAALETWKALGFSAITNENDKFAIRLKQCQEFLKISPADGTLDAITKKRLLIGDCKNVVWK